MNRLSPASYPQIIEMKSLTRLKLLPILLMALLSGCFTGVEYTPTVSHRDVRKENIITTPEDTFLVNVADEGLAEWRPGRGFVSPTIKSG